MLQATTYLGDLAACPSHQLKILTQCTIVTKCDGYSPKNNLCSCEFVEITKRSERSWGKCLTGWGAGGRWNPVGAGRRQGVITNQGCSSPGKELCYWFLSVGHQHLLLTTSFYLLWVSVHFNKQEFICRLGVWLGSQVRFLSKGLFVCVPYNIVFKLFKFLCELSPSLQTIKSWRRLRKQLQPHLKSDCHGKVLTLGELGSNTHREGERVELSQEPKWQCQPSCRLPPSLTAPTVRLF